MYVFIIHDKLHDVVLFSFLVIWQAKNLNTKAKVSFLFATLFTVRTRKLNKKTT